MLTHEAGLFFVMKMSESPGSVRRHPPMLGEHTREVLSTLGYTEIEIDGFEKEGVV